jgi:NAD+ diphosphatase
MTFVKELLVPSKQTSKPYWFFFLGTKLLVGFGDKSKYTIPRFETPDRVGISCVRTQYLGKYNDICCFSADVTDEITLPKDMDFLNLFDIFSMINSDMLHIAFYAIQIVAWDRNFQFCGRCGSKTTNMENERAKICRTCNLISYPRQSPAIIVAITRGDKLLLARSKRFKPSDMYSVLAGFVDPGESFEECVRREIREEVSIEVKNIQYFGNQSWPFPDSLMIGFTAEYKSGEISIDNDEIDEAGWFSVSELPRIPRKISIARQLIDWFIERETK